MSFNPLANTTTSRCCQLLLALLLLSLTYSSSQVLAQFTEAPADLNVTEGDPLSLNCTYTGAERIFWQKDGREITPGNGDFSTASATADTSTLTLLPSAEHTTHTGLYGCVAVTQGGIEVSSNFTITVQYLADVSINFLPFQCTEGNENPYIGSMVTITCFAEGEPFPRVTWFFQGRELRDSEVPNINFQQNKRVLVIPSLQSNNSGSYHCQSVNDLFSAKSSSNIELGFQAPSSMEVRITNADSGDIIYAALGRLTVIKCSVFPPIPTHENVVFRRQGSNIITGQEYSIVALPCNEFALSISPVEITHAGSYVCALDLPSGTLTDSVNIQIGTIVPVVVMPFGSTTIGVGRNITFYCRGDRMPEDGDIPQILFWQFLQEGSNELSGVAPIDGRVQIIDDEDDIISVLTLLNVMPSDAGTFTCVTSNPDQPSIMESSSVTLTVEATPNVTVTPPSSIVRVGAPLSLTCKISTTQRNSTFLWAINGVNVKQLGDRYIITDAPNNSTLKISRLDASDIGQVRCTAKDPIHLPVTAEATIKETTELYIVGQLEGEAKPHVNVSVQIQTNFVLNCTVRNAAIPTTISWFLGHDELNGDDPGFSVNESAGTLTKNNVSLSDEDPYLCIAKVGGTTLELTVNVAVTIPPSFTDTPDDFTEGVQGQRFELTCEAAGRPTPTIFWTKMSRNVTELRDPLIQDLGDGSLVFERLQMQHEGFYHCEIKGARMSAQTRLTVVDRSDNGIGNLNESETILVFTVVGLVAILIIIASVMLIAVLCSCFYMRRPHGKYSVAKGDQLDGGFNKRQNSLRDNSGIHSSPSNHIFDTLQSPSSTTGYSSNPYSSGPAHSMPLTTYGGTIPVTVGNEEILGGGARGMATNSMFSENVNSHTSTPIHGTLASTSLFGSEEQTSVTTQLPNFPRANLQLGDAMGEGEFGPVVLGVAIGIVPNEERTLVAVKAIVPRGGGEEGEEELNPEIALVDFANQMKLEFANIAMILGMCTDEEPYYVIYEYLNEGDLKKFLINSRPFDDDPPSLTPQHMQRIILQVADGMAYLFSQRIIHGDLATRNCLISSDLRVKIADLGIGHDLYNNDYYDNGSQLLPIRWMPPELLVNSDEGPTFSLHSDIWSFGVLCWEVFSYSRLPYDSLTDEDVLSMVPAGTRLRSPSKSCPPALYDIMMDCWHDIPEERPVFAKLCVAIIGCELD